MRVPNGAGTSALQGSNLIQARIAQTFEDLSPQLQKAASFVLEHPDDVATHSLRQVAQAAEVAPPTLSRLARALSCESYEALREICRQDIKRRSRSLAEKARGLQALDLAAGPEPAGERQPFVLRQTHAALGNLGSMAQDIDVADLRAAVDRLMAARRVALIATMSSGFFLQYMAYMAAMAFDNWRLVLDEPTGIASNLALLNEQDAAIVMSHAPYARRTVDAARQCRAAGAYVLAITDSAASPLLAMASAHFLVPTDSPQFFPSNVATLNLIESIMGMLVRRADPSIGDRVAAVEAANHSLGEYWHNQ